MNGHTLNYILHLADTSLILGHRNSEWCGHGPVLEQDIAITNISLDLIGQARNFYQYAASLSSEGTTEDTLAYHRDAPEFRNLILVEQPNTDWAHTILRQYFYSSFQQLLFSHLTFNADEQLAAIVTKALKEITYHVRWSSEWVIRLGDGTDESNARMLKASEELFRYTNEFFTLGDFERPFIPDKTIAEIKTEWESRLAEVFAEGALPTPVRDAAQYAGKTGEHVHLELILEEMQVLPRTYPDATW